MDNVIDIDLRRRIKLFRQSVERGIVDREDQNVIPDSIKLVAGRVGQEYNIRKKRKGAFWEDRYHATAVEDGQHLIRCMVYIDLNMVRNGVVPHPSEWPFCGYNEILAPRKKCVLLLKDGNFTELTVSASNCNQVVLVR